MFAPSCPQYPLIRRVESLEQQLLQQIDDRVCILLQISAYCHMTLPKSFFNTEADTRDLHRAQQMEIIFTSITSTPDTQPLVRTILHGKYESIVEEAEEGNKWVRMHLVAAHLSGRTQHALEWAIGMVHRGDTRMAISASDRGTTGDGGKMVLDNRIAEALSRRATAMGTSIASINISHTPGVLGYRGRSVLVG